MSKYKEQLMEEVKKSRLLHQNYDSFGLSDDRSPLVASYASLATANMSNSRANVKSSNEEWEKALHDYKQQEELHPYMDTRPSRAQFHRELLKRNVSSHSWKWFPPSKMNAKLWNLLLIRIFTLFMLIFTLMIVIVPIILSRVVDKADWCPLIKNHHLNMNATSEPVYENPDYDTDPCDRIRIPLLMYLSMQEADHCQKMLISVALGAIIGFERRSADRPAGIRTMSLVSLGACFFTISSNFAFKSSTMGWDSSRVSAAIPSGCGFLGAGLIWKGTVQDKHEVHGLTTAAGIWLSAAIGVGCGGGMYFVSVYTAILVTSLLRFGPKVVLHHHSEKHQKGSSKSNDSQSYVKRDSITSVRGMNVSVLSSEDVELFEVWKNERASNSFNTCGHPGIQKYSNATRENTDNESPAYLLPS